MRLKAPEFRRAARPWRGLARAWPQEDRPPAILVGGGANALAIARSLGRYGVAVYAINLPHEPVCRSRYARWIRISAGEDYAAAWADFLLGPQSDPLRGAVLLAASDAALELFAQYRPQLEHKYRLDDANPQAHLCMLNKLSTYRAATAAGVETPRYWVAGSLEQIEGLRPSLVFPLIVKPQLSHVFEERFGRKFLVAGDFDELRAAWSAVRDARIDVLLVEQIPGPDDLLCSYYTYLDERGERLFDFTKRIIRRNPPGMGPACYHVTDWVPEVIEPSLRLLRQAGLRGVANVEFKLDPRDGRLKLIECNPRFCASHRVIERAGFDLGRFVYNRVVGLPQPPLTAFRTGVRLWFPIEDFKAFRALRREGRTTLRAWLASLCHRQCLSCFSLRDPAPALADLFRRIGRKLRRS